MIVNSGLKVGLGDMGWRECTRHMYVVWGDVMDFEGVQYTGEKLESRARR